VHFPNTKEVGKGVLSIVIGISRMAIPLFISKGMPRKFKYVCMLINDLSMTLRAFFNYLLILFSNMMQQFI